ncbi:hypothetical protein AABM06_02720 [Listeria ivanovii]|uniref:hypothetical protein n=1 Tax=Listeria ivanovii TaxID=1638 RepID=UPI0011185AF4|nr:hypothetical protein [Listeria ivanovii]MBC1758485.1 hypothetical protein [Listeria ivanovii]MBK3925649.1 hypothetical protein [Listeria ivanovii subsp. ivanovii]MCJ1721676.1 hypothetical protein [Listeria ivanovii]MCJ1734307.1 hypothetical protein [Listeria ivanovii]QDA72644.1 hypothetical protein EOS99_10715 [Listeria ivanovii]
MASLSPASNTGSVDSSLFSVEGASKLVSFPLAFCCSALSVSSAKLLKGVMLRINTHVITTNFSIFQSPCNM